VSPRSPATNGPREGARLQFRSLEDWLDSDEALSSGLRGVELGIETRGREIQRLLVQSHVDRQGPGDVGPTIQVGHGQNLRVLTRQRQLRHRGVATLYGEVHVRRYRYAPRRGPCVHPLDEALHLPQRSYSYELQRRLVKRAVQGPFQEAIDGLRESTGVNIPRGSVQQILEDASREMDAFYAQRAGPDPKTDRSILVASIDGKGIPMVRPGPAPRVVRRGKGEKPGKKRMATVAAVFTMKPRVRTPLEVVESHFNPEKKKCPGKTWERPQNKRVWASLRAGKDAFVEDVKAEVGLGRQVCAKQTKNGSGGVIARPRGPGFQTCEKQANPRELPSGWSLSGYDAPDQSPSRNRPSVP